MKLLVFSKESRDISDLLEIIFFIFSSLLIIPFLAGLFYKEYRLVLIYLSLSLVAFFVGVFLRKKSKSLSLPYRSSDYTAQYIAVALIWVVFSILASLPFYFTGLFRDLLGLSTIEVKEMGIFASWDNSFYEGVSGITTTGLTLINPENTPLSILIWRSILQWWGGLGMILTSALFLLKLLNFKFLEVEMNELIEKRDPQKKIKTILIGYLSLTIIAFIGYLTLGMNWWESLNHSMTTVSTGGFSVRSNSFTGYNNAIKIFSCIIMTFSAVNLISLVQIFYKFKWKLFKNDRPLKVMIGLALLGMMVADFSAGHIEDSWFNWIAALTTTGFSSGDMSQWSGAFTWLIITGMATGGCVGSTASGIKVNRVISHFDNIKLYLEELWDNSSHKSEPDLKDQSTKEMEFRNTLRFASLLTILWVFSLLLGAWISFLFSNESITMDHVLFDTISALANVGQSKGTMIATTHWIPKFTFSFLMLIGRLEIISFLVLFSFYLRWVIKEIKKRIS